MQFDEQIVVELQARKINELQTLVDKKDAIIKQALADCNRAIKQLEAQRAECLRLAEEYDRRGE